MFFSFIQALIKFKIFLLRVLSYLLGGCPWGEFVASYTYVDSLVAKSLSGLSINPSIVDCGAFIPSSILCGSFQ